MSEIKQFGAQLRGERPVTLADGQTYTVYFSINAIIDLQEKHKSLKNIFAEFSKGEGMDFGVFRSFLYHGLKTKHPELTEERVGDLIDFFSFGEIMQDVFGGIQDALPSNEEK